MIIFGLHLSEGAMVDQDYLRDNYYYSDGNLYHKAKSFTNHVMAGDIVGSFNCTGYKTTKIKSKSYLVHRLIFMYFHGFMPKYIDHINCDKTDNRIENLRECTAGQNRANVTASKRSKTGIKGVSYNKQQKAFIARVQHQGKRLFLGYFDNIDDAKAAVDSKRLEVHGEYANNSEVLK